MPLTTYMVLDPRHDHSLRIPRPDLSVADSYVYAVALHSTGSPRRAIAVLKGALTRSPHDRDILLALATFHRDLGDVDAAIGFAERLVAVVPHDPGVQQLLQQLCNRR